jgi:hypothetical protein
VDSGGGAQGEGASAGGGKGLMKSPVGNDSPAGLCFFRAIQNLLLDEFANQKPAIRFNFQDVKPFW